MNLRIRLTILYSVLFLVPAITFGQSISNVKAENQSGKVIITYDLNGSNDVKYNITLFGSHDSYQTQLRYVVGDVGKGVTAGPGKRIEWDVNQELVTYQGNITFKIRGEVIALPLSINTPSSARQGKTTTITWSGGKRDQKVHIDLVKDGTVAQSIGDTNNTGTYKWSVPKDIAKGSYQLRLTSGNETVNSQSFSLNKKIPLWIIAAPVVVVGVIVAVLVSKPKSNSGGGDGPLPDAPTPKN
jgi:hypothetical protein